MNETAVVETDAGPFFAKWNRSPLPHLFEREAEGLRALAASGTSLRVPRPVCARADLLVMEYLPPGRPAPDLDERFGRGLAELHRATAPAYGFPHDNYCGTTPQPNGWLDDWTAFWRERRLRFQLDLAADMPRDERRVFDRLLGRLDALLVAEPPALIHGDLWGGNRHVAPDGGPAIVDPAAYYGHREAELGMMVLFGGFSARVFAAYEEVRPLAPGWRDRLPLYSLYHVLNHRHLFGGGYGAQALRIARRFTG
jgi:fructosamine-3-kinase